MAVYKEDTIAAIASGATNSGISIIRVSGQKAIPLIAGIFKGKTPLEKAESHTVHYGYIMDGDNILDEVLVLVFRAPKTYTKEDVVEIDCHGGSLITKQVLEAVFKTGVRPAEPGEFTKRAFLNGRIDLSEAEAVMDVINATGNAAVKQSVKQLRGAMRDEIRELRNIILDDTAYIEAALDDPEHIDVDEYRGELEKNINHVLKRTDELIASFDRGKLVKEGIDTVILGRPNAGKSTLLNYFAGEDRAIVTDIAGTTRDLLEVTVKLKDLILNITDTAGLRDTVDPIEKIGVEKAKNKAKDAELILYIIDGTREISGQELDFMRTLVDKKVVALVNKIDVEGCVSAADIASQTGIETIEISAKSNIGLEKLEDRILKLFFNGELPENEPVFVTNERHKNVLVNARELLDNARETLENGLSEDFIAMDLKQAYDTLGLIIGETADEDLFNRIFEKFCLGK